MVVGAFAFTIKGDIEPIKVGADMPEAAYAMKATDGKEYALNDLKKENGLLVIFSCNTCPFVVGGKETEGWEGRYNGVFEAAKSNKIGMVLVNSNAAKRSKGDSMKDMKKRAKDKNLMATYVLDENSKLADSFGAITTPHVFLFNGESKLAYAGAIDDNVASASDVKENWLENALTKLAKGEKVDPSQTRQKGCSIKRVK